MPIKGLSEIRRLPRLGKIHLGVKVSTSKGTTYPKAVDYFVIPDELKPIYGEQPRDLEIVFPVPDRELIFPQYLKAYGVSGLLCKGDGEVAYRVNRDTGEIDEIACCPDECELYNAKKCRKVAHLQFMLPDAPGLGVYQIDTSSYHSIVNLNSCLDMIESAVGRVHMIPLQLSLREKQVQPDGIKKTVWVMHLTAKVSLRQLLKAVMPKPTPFALDKPDDSEAPWDLFAIEESHDNPELADANGAAQTNQTEREPAEVLPEVDTPQNQPEPVPEEPATKPSAREMGNLKSFWQSAVNLGFTQEQVYSVAGTDNLAGWTKQQLNALLTRLAEIKRTNSNQSSQGNLLS
ncbi:MAG TPA: hypothetical protein GXX40_05555 [Firmicutes bacterium]|nr:hypothetical protein [Bacillota bacterium]